MTPHDLLDAIGDADDEYVMEAHYSDLEQQKKKAQQEKQAARKQAEKHSARRLIPLAIAACLMLVVFCTGAGILLHGMYSHSAADTAQMAAEAQSSVSAEDTAVNAAAAAPETAEDAAADADDTEASAADAADTAGTGSAAGSATLLAQAADVSEPSEWTEENQLSDTAVSALNTFSYRTAAAVLSGCDRSACFSPLSLYTALSVAASGSAGNTQSQLLELLGMPDLDTLADTVGTCLSWNTRFTDTDTLRLADSIWLDGTASNGTALHFNSSWIQSASSQYHADVYSADFSDPSTGDTLGSWIARKTGNFLSPTGQELNLPEETVMAIINTVWYKSQWQSPFSEADNTEDDFTLTDGTPVTCTFMHRTDESGRAVHGDGYTKSRLFLSTGRIIIVLPDVGVNIDDLLTEEKLTEIFEDANYEDASVEWSVPKFDNSCTFSGLADTLQSLGVTDAFTDDADFSGIAEESLKISTLQQGTRISVDENGIEAAAYTDLGMELAGIMVDELPKVEMNLNRPFLYLITADDGTTLFMGIVRNPLDN